MPIESIDVRVRGNGDVMTIAIRATDPPELIAERLQTITWLARQLGPAAETRKRSRNSISDEPAHSTTQED